MCAVFYAVGIFVNGNMNIYSTLLKFTNEHTLLYDTQSRPIASCGVVCVQKRQTVQFLFTADPLGIQSSPRKGNMTQIIKLAIMSLYNGLRVFAEFSRSCCEDESRRYLETETNAWNC
jgi:hypothetical protein